MIIIIIIRAFVRRTMSASELNLREFVVNKQTENDQFITRSLLSPRVKNFENRSTFAEVMGN